MPKALDVVNAMADHIEDGLAELYKIAGDEKAEDIDVEWVHIARRHFKQGLMCARKAAFKAGNKF